MRQLGYNASPPFENDERRGGGIEFGGYNDSGQQTVVAKQELVPPEKLVVETRKMPPDAVHCVSMDRFARSSCAPYRPLTIGVEGQSC